MKAKSIWLLTLGTTIVILASLVAISSLMQSATAGWWMALNNKKGEGVKEISGNNEYVSWGAKKGDGIAFL